MRLRDKQPGQLERCHREWNRRNNLSLRGARRRSNLLPDEPSYAHQAGDCFGAARLAMTVSTHGDNALAPTKLLVLFVLPVIEQTVANVVHRRTAIGYPSRQWG
jgi:hypothetical protein